jgi:hypothetical protein
MCVKSQVWPVREVPGILFYPAARSLITCPRARGHAFGAVHVRTRLDVVLGVVTGGSFGVGPPMRSLSAWFVPCLDDGRREYVTSLISPARGGC